MSGLFHFIICFEIHILYSMYPFYYGIVFHCIDMLPIGFGFFFPVGAIISNANLTIHVQGFVSIYAFISWRRIAGLYGKFMSRVCF